MIIISSDAKFGSAENAATAIYHTHKRNSPAPGAHRNLTAKHKDFSHHVTVPLFCSLVSTTVLAVN